MQLVIKMAKTFEQRPYQDRIHTKSIDYLQRPNNGIAKTLLIEAPTGAGKTVMAMRLCKALEERGHKIGWVAHRRELLKQAQNTNEEFFGVENIDFVSLFTRTPEDYKGCNVMVVDECQHDASKTASILHEIIRPDIIVGLTATPYRTDRAQLCFQKVVRDAGIHQLIREGYLAEFKQWILDCDWTPENIARTYLEDPEKWGKSVAYFLTIEEAKQCSELLRSGGVRAEYIVGDSPREDILQAFENGELDILTNVAVLTEGFDSPTLKTSFVRPSSKAPTVQMAGRAFRKHSTKPFANIVQNRDTKYPFTKHARAMDQFIQDHGKWRSIMAKNLNNVLKEQIHKVVTAKVEIPEFVLKARGKMKRFRNI